LTPIGTRHSLLTKSKTFQNRSRITSNAEKLTGSDVEPVIIREESNDEDATMPLDQIPEEDGVAGEDDKKKLGFKTTYEGFSIWGWVLCLLVTRKGGPTKKKTEYNAGQVLMEEWISSTQQQQEEEG
jgi:hypothetical protein